MKSQGLTLDPINDLLARDRVVRSMSFRQLINHKDELVDNPDYEKVAMGDVAVDYVGITVEAQKGLFADALTQVLGAKVTQWFGAIWICEHPVSVIQENSSEEKSKPSTLFKMIRRHHWEVILNELTPLLIETRKINGLSAVALKSIVDEEKKAYLNYISNQVMSLFSENNQAYTLKEYEEKKLIKQLVKSALKGHGKPREGGVDFVGNNSGVEGLYYVDEADNDVLFEALEPRIVQYEDKIHLIPELLNLPGYRAGIDKLIIQAVEGNDKFAFAASSRAQQPVMSVEEKINLFHAAASTIIVDLTSLDRVTPQYDGYFVIAVSDGQQVYVGTEEVQAMAEYLARPRLIDFDFFAFREYHATGLPQRNQLFANKIEPLITHALQSLPSGAREEKRLAISALTGFLKKFAKAGQGEWYLPVKVLGLEGEGISGKSLVLRLDILASIRKSMMHDIKTASSHNSTLLLNDRIKHYIRYLYGLKAIPLAADIVLEQPVETATAVQRVEQVIEKCRGISLYENDLGRRTLVFIANERRYLSHEAGNQLVSFVNEALSNKQAVDDAIIMAKLKEVTQPCSKLEADLEVALTALLKDHATKVDTGWVIRATFNRALTQAKRSLIANESTEWSADELKEWRKSFLEKNSRANNINRTMIEEALWKELGFEAVLNKKMRGQGKNDAQTVHSSGVGIMAGSRVVPLEKPRKEPVDPHASKERRLAADREAKSLKRESAPRKKQNPHASSSHSSRGANQPRNAQYKEKQEQLSVAQPLTARDERIVKKELHKASEALLSMAKSLLAEEKERDVSNEINIVRHYDRLSDIAKFVKAMQAAHLAGLVGFVPGKLFELKKVAGVSCEACLSQRTMDEGSEALTNSGGMNAAKEASKEAVYSIVSYGLADFLRIFSQNNNLFQGTQIDSLKTMQASLRSIQVGLLAPLGGTSLWQHFSILRAHDALRLSDLRSEQKDVADDNFNLRKIALRKSVSDIHSIMNRLKSKYPVCPSLEDDRQYEAMKAGCYQEMKAFTEVCRYISHLYLERDYRLFLGKAEKEGVEVSPKLIQILKFMQAAALGLNDFDEKNVIVKLYRAYDGYLLVKQGGKTMPLRLEDDEVSLCAQQLIDLQVGAPPQPSVVSSSAIASMPLRSSSSSTAGMLSSLSSPASSSASVSSSLSIAGDMSAVTPSLVAATEAVSTIVLPETLYGDGRGSRQMAMPPGGVVPPTLNAGAPGFVRSLNK